MQYVLMLPPGTAPWDRGGVPRHRENTLVLYHGLPSIHAVCAWCGHHIPSEQVINLYVTPEFCDIITRYGKSHFIACTQSFWTHHAAPIFFGSPIVIRGHVPCIARFFAQWVGTPAYETGNILVNLFSFSPSFSAKKLQFIHHLVQYLSTPEFSLADFWYSGCNISEKYRLSTRIAWELTQYISNAIVPTPQQDRIWRFLLSQFLSLECIYQNSKPTVSLNSNSLNSKFVISVMSHFDKFDSNSNTKQYLQNIQQEHFRSSQDFFHYLEETLKKTYVCFVTGGGECHWTGHSPPPLFQEETYHGVFTT